MQEQELIVAPHRESESVPENGLNGGKDIVKEKEVYEFGHSMLGSSWSRMRKYGTRHFHRHLTL